MSGFLKFGMNRKVFKLVEPRWSVRVHDQSYVVDLIGVIFTYIQMLFRNGSTFDEAAALAEVITKYGVEEPEIKAESPAKKKRKSDAHEEDTLSPSSTAKKPRKTDIVVVEGNRAAAEAIKEMADIYFKNKDGRKGGELMHLLNYNTFS